MQPVQKKEIAPARARRLINSGNLILVTSSFKNEKNILTLAWSTPLSNDPPLVGISVAKKHKTSALIRESGEYIINIPGREQMDAVLYCGKHSGWHADKFRETGLTPQPAAQLQYPSRIAECLGCMECKVINSVETGDHFFFIGEILYAEAEATLFHEVWDTTRAELLYHLGGNVFMTPGPLAGSGL